MEVIYIPARSATNTNATLDSHSPLGSEEQLDPTVSFQMDIERQDHDRCHSIWRD